MKTRIYAAPAVKGLNRIIIIWCDKIRGTEMASISLWCKSPRHAQNPFSGECREILSNPPCLITPLSCDHLYTIDFLSTDCIVLEYFKWKFMSKRKLYNLLGLIYYYTAVQSHRVFRATHCYDKTVIFLYTQGHLISHLNLTLPLPTSPWYLILPPETIFFLK